MRCLPTSYVEAMARQKSMQPGSKSFEEWMAQLSAVYNMDGGIVSGFFKWLGSMLRGDFGDSWKWTVPVIEKFNDTVWLSFVAYFVVSAGRTAPSGFFGSAARTG
jgi:peptide/nickel transport system permease protein